MDFISTLILTVSALVFVVFTGLTFVDLKREIADNEPDNLWVNIFLGFLSAIAGALVAGLIGVILLAGRLVVGRIVESTSQGIDWVFVGWAVVFSFLVGFVLSRK